MKTWIWSHISKAHINRQAWCGALVIPHYRDRDRRDPWSLAVQLLSPNWWTTGGGQPWQGWHMSLLSSLYTHEQTHTFRQCWLSIGFGRNWVDDGVLKGITGRCTYLALQCTAGSLGGDQEPSREWTVECGSALGQKEVSEYHPYLVE